MRCVVCKHLLIRDHPKAITHPGRCREIRAKLIATRAHNKRKGTDKYRQFMRRVVSNWYFKKKADPAWHAAYKRKRAAYYKERYRQNGRMRASHMDAGRKRKQEGYKFRLISEFHKLLAQIKELAMSLDIMQTTPSKVFDFKRINTMTLDEAIAAYEKVFEFTSTAIMYMAKLWGRIKELEGDTSQLHRSGFVKYLELINENQVSAKAVATFAEKPKLLSRITKLPFKEQERLANGGTVSLVVDGGGQNGSTTRKVKLTDNLPDFAIKQIIGENYIRDEAEQIKMREVNVKATKALPAVRTAKRGKVYVDRRSGMLQIGKATAPIDDVVAALRAIGAIV